MKTITKKFDLYEFYELDKRAQDRAITDYIRFEIEIMTEESPYWHCVEEMENLHTPWFLADCIYDHHSENIIETIRINNYLFFKEQR